MTGPSPLFDASLARARMRRTAPAGDFLQRHVAHLTAERLNEVNRSFQRACILGPWATLWAEILMREASVTATHVGPAADVLGLESGAHDLVIHALNLHHNNDPVGQLVQSRLGLAADGLVIASLFGGDTLADLRQAFAAAEIACLGGITPRVAPMGDIPALGALVQRAGLALPVADSVPLDVSHASPVALMHDLRAMGETNILTARHKKPMTRQLLTDLVARYPTCPDGRILTRFEVVFLTGWAPHESQQKPLRPGAAQMRLADVLKVPEQPAGEKTGR